MTDHEIDMVLAPLIVAFSFTEPMVKLWNDKLAGLTDGEAALRTANALIDDVETLRAPAWGLFKKTYDRWYARLEEERRERELALEQPQGRLAGMVSPKEGRQIAAAAYAKHYKRRPPADIFDLPDPEFVPEASAEDIETALGVIRGGYDHEGMTFSSYVEVLKAFNGHQLTARAAVKALEDSGRIIHRTNGQLILLRVRTIQPDEPV
jgi:hypothetical protein